MTRSPAPATAAPWAHIQEAPLLSSTSELTGTQFLKCWSEEDRRWGRRTQGPRRRRQDEAQPSKSSREVGSYLTPLPDSPAGPAHNGTHPVLTKPHDDGEIQRVSTRLPLALLQKELSPPPPGCPLEQQRSGRALGGGAGDRPATLGSFHS